MNFSLILGSDVNGVISTKYTFDDGTVNDCGTYHYKDRMHVKKITTYSPTGAKNLIIVGRKTWDTLSTHMKNCESRDYIVMSRNGPYNTTRKMIEYCISKRNEYYKFFIFGGAEIYKTMMQETDLVNEIFLSVIHTENFKFDFGYKHKENIIFDIQQYLNKFDLKSKNSYNNEGKTEIDFYQYERKFLPFETQYVDLLYQIQLHGTIKSSRNGIVMSANGGTMIKVNLEDGIPILTIRKSAPKWTIAEYLWIVSGSTDVNDLQKQNVTIWNKNSTKEFLFQAGLNHLKEGDIGSSYGFQLRHSGAEYIDCKTDYTGKGTDQFTECARLIKEDPDSRRIMINLWNVEDLKQMALPPCAFGYQFLVSNGKLDVVVYQRSWDVSLGWNYTTGALFVHNLAHYCDLQPGILTHMIGNPHTYKVHENEISQFINNAPYKLPQMKIVGDKPKTPDGYTKDQFVFEGYKSGPHIKMEMQ